MKETLAKDSIVTLVRLTAPQENDSTSLIQMPNRYETNPLRIPLNGEQWDDFFERERWWNAVIKELI